MFRIKCTIGTDPVRLARLCFDDSRIWKTETRPTEKGNFLFLDHGPLVAEAVGEEQLLLSTEAKGTRRGVGEQATSRYSTTSYFNYRQRGRKDNLAILGQTFE